MSNRFHVQTRTQDNLSSEEIQALLTPNNAASTHSPDWVEPRTTRRPSKKEREIARRNNIREAHAADYSKEDK